MAHLIEAVRRYGPRPAYGTTVDQDQLAKWLARSSGLNQHAVRMTLRELHDGILFFAGVGAPVSIEGLARFRPTMGRDGTLRVRVMPSHELVHGLRAPGAFTGNVHNVERVGWTDAQYKALWDAEHSDDPLELGEPGEEPGEGPGTDPGGVRSAVA